jgi:hypothetical protein
MSDYTINPSLLFNMTNPADENQMFDPSLVDGNDLVNYDFSALGNFNNAELYGQDNGYVDSILDGSATTAPVFDTLDYSRQPQEIVPMQQSVNPSPATLLPPQGLPAMPAGMAYHPAVGWYYPISNSQAPGFSGAGASGAAPSFAAPPAPMLTQAPAAPVSGFGNVMDNMTPKTSRPKRAAPSNKRKYGPSVYLDDLAQAKRRAIGDDNASRPVSRGVDYPKPANWAQQQKKQNAAQAAGAMKDINIATVQRCRCALANNVTKQHISRPRNAFIIFRTRFSAHWRTTRGVKRGTDNVKISKAAGEVWAELKQNGGIAKYQREAAIEKAEHKKQYPNYTYTPIKKIQARFGQADCTCGAYQTNMAELQRLREGGATPPNHFTASSDSENDEGDYTAPRTRSVSRANSIQAPAAQTEPSTYDVDMSGYEFSFEPGNEWEALQAFNEAVEEDNDAADPPAKRRSSRNGKKAVHYADNADEDEEEVTAIQKHRPSPISISRKSSTSSQISSLNSADFRLDDATSVASRTRSKSVSEDEAGLPTGNSSPNSLFDESDDGDNIIVATPKASPKRVVLALPPKRTARQTRSQSRGRERRRS